MACALREDLSDADSVHRLAQKLQVLAGNSAGPSDWDVRELLAGVAPQPTAAGDLLVRGLVYEWLVRAGLRYQIRMRATPTPHYELVPARDRGDHTLGEITVLTVAERARSLINERHAEPLTNAIIARHVACSPSYLSRAFRAVYGMAPGQYLQRVRARVGIELLQTTDLVVEVISRRVGFRAKSNFYAAVRAATGKTPGAVRGQSGRRARRRVFSAVVGESHE
jgi:AraC-like DNA-binding protein